MSKWHPVFVYKFAEISLIIINDCEYYDEYARIIFINRLLEKVIKKEERKWEKEKY